MKLNIRKKEYIILFICTFIFALIVNSVFLQRQYSSDTMCLIDIGYFEYPLKFFLLDGRLFSALICFMGGILDLSIDTYLFISAFIGILMLTLSVIVLFKFVVEYLDIRNKWIKTMAVLSIYTIIFNHMNIDFLQYQEACVMCAGVFFSVLASITCLKGGNNKFGKSFVLLTISTICYQGVINLFPVLVITLYFLKEKQEPKETLKYYAKEILKLGIIIILVMAISAATIYLFNSILESSTNRLERIKNIFYMIKEIPLKTFNIMMFQENRIPKYLAVLVICITNIIIGCGKNKKLLLKYNLTIITAYIFSIVPMIVFGYLETRMLMSIGAVMGISLLFITILLNEPNSNISIKNIKTVIISLCVISCFIFNVINNIANSYEHLKAFKLDEEIGKKINELMIDYEKTSGKKITKLAYCGDIEVKRQDKNIKDLGALTERKFVVPTKEVFNYYCNRKLEIVRFLTKIYYEKFYGINYTEFSEEQVIFVDDTIYICIY